MKLADAKINELLEKKLALLETISVNTKIQLRFIGQRKCKGLLRLLQERAHYLQDVVTLTSEIDRAQSDGIAGQAAKEAVRKIIPLIQAKLQEIIRDNREVLAAAQAERGNIIADLHRVRSQRKVRSSYYTRWVNTPGRQFNQKG